MYSAVSRYLSQSLVGIIPPLTPIEPYRDINMNVWRTNGSHHLLGSSKKEFVLGANQRNYASHLIAEIEHLLNHASEHRAHMLNAISTNREPSPTWMFVSLYYFSLFIAMAWTRMANKGIFYLDKDAIGIFCGAQKQAPAAGAYRVIASENLTKARFEVTYKKCNRSHFHEAVWLETSEITKQIHTWVRTLSSSRKPTDDEILAIRSMELFQGVKFIDQQTWPSTLRNSLNYRPGFGYRSVPKHNSLKTTSRLSKPRLNNLSEVLTLGENAKVKLSQFKEPFNSPNESIDLLVAQSLVLEAYVEESLKQLFDIHQLSCSAHSSRKKFDRQYAASTNSLLSSLC